MKTFILAGLALSVSAWGLDIEKYPYMGNGANQSRSPCPFLNTLANHGVIPYDGTMIHFDVIQEACINSGNNKKIFKFSRDFMKKIAKILHDRDVENKVKDPHPLDRISLSDLNMREPHVVEHDLSITRYDVGNPKNTAGPNSELLEELIKMAPMGSSGKRVADYSTMARFIKWRREEEEKVHQVEFGFNSHTACAGELVFALELMGRNGQIDEDYIRSFFIHERFPKGWKPAHPDDLGFVSFNVKMFKLIAMFHLPASWLQKPQEKDQLYLPAHSII